MLVTSHAAAGAVLGVVVRRPLAAVAVAGVASHLAMDMLPHWGVPGLDVRDPRFLRVAVPDGLGCLALTAGLGRLASPALRPAVLAGAAAAVFPDLDKPARLVLRRRVFPRRFQDLHERIQREAPHRLPRDLVVTAGLAAVAAAVTALAGR